MVIRLFQFSKFEMNNCGVTTAQTTHNCDLKKTVNSKLNDNYYSNNVQQQQTATKTQVI